MGRWRGHGSALDRLPEEQLELRTKRTELSRRREREVDLQVSREEEHAIQGRQKGQIEEVSGTQVLDQMRCPFTEHVTGGDALSEAKPEVEVGPAIARALRERADQSASDDAWVGPSHREDRLPDSFAFIYGEHAGSAFGR